MPDRISVPPSGAAWRAERADDTGLRELLQFVPVGEDAILCHCVMPPGQARGGVVLASPIQAEMMRNYRREVLVARELARHGLAALRFDYRGAGNSPGDPSHLTIESMRDDVTAAMGWLRSTSGVSHLALQGTFLGGLAAASAAPPDAPLVLWEPVSDVTRYFRDVLRAQLIHEMASGHESHPSSDLLLEELRSTGVVGILGFSIHRLLMESAQQFDLRGSLAGRRGPVFIVQANLSGTIRGGVARLVEQLRSADVDVATAAITGEIPWWFQDSSVQDPGLDQRLIETIVGWLTEKAIVPA